MRNLRDDYAVLVGRRASNLEIVGPTLENSDAPLPIYVRTCEYECEYAYV